MPTEQEVAAASRALSAGLAMIATFLGLRQWYEQKGRDKPPFAPDVAHFRRQDVRRWAGVVVLGGIALLALLGSRTASLVQGRGNPIFFLIWIVVLALILVLIVLAMSDSLATRRYAQRHRKLLIRDSIDDLRRDREERASSLADGPIDVDQSEEGREQLDR